MNVVKSLDLALGASAHTPTRPATTIAFDSPDARVVLFRLEPGQVVAPHTSASTVLLFVMSGTGIVTGAEGERAVEPDDVVTYAPSERHGLRATTERFVVAAVIAPRPGAVR